MKLVNLGEIGKWKSEFNGWGWALRFQLCFLAPLVVVKLMLPGWPFQVVIIWNIHHNMFLLHLFSHFPRNLPPWKEAPINLAPQALHKPCQPHCRDLVECQTNNKYPNLPKFIHRWLKSIACGAPFVIDSYLNWDYPTSTFRDAWTNRIQLIRWQKRFREMIPWKIKYSKQAFNLWL